MTEYVLDGCDHPHAEPSEDCLVCFILDRPEGAVVFDAAEERALRSLAGAGLVPRVRLKRKVG